MAPKRKNPAQNKGKAKVGSSSSSNPVLETLSNSQEQRYMEHFAWKHVYPSRYGVLSSFPPECFSFQDDLKEYGLESALSCFGPCYPDLVRAFYCNLHVEEGVLVTIVMGKRIVLTSKIVGKVLDIPFSGSTLYDKDDEAWQGYDKKTFYYSIGRLTEAEFHAKRVRNLGGIEPSRSNWSAGIFHIDDRLFHFFLVYILFPRAGNHCTVTDLEMQLLYARKNNIKVNWARLILIHMKKFSTKVKFLPYAWFITLILRHYGIKFNGHETVMMDEQLHKISIANVDSRMGVLYNPETKTIRYIGEDVVGPDEGEHEDINDHQGFAAEDNGAAIPEHGPSNQAMMDYMTAQFSSLNTSINNQWTAINDSTSTRINAFQLDVNNQFAYLYSHLHIPPYDPNNPAPPPPLVNVQPIQRQFPNQGPFFSDMDQP